MQLSLWHTTQLFVIFMVPFSSETTHRSVCHLSHHFLNCILVFVQNIFALLCFPKIFPLPLSPSSNTYAYFWRFCPFFIYLFFFFLPSFSLSSPLLVLCLSPPSSPSHRYLTPRFKTEFYDVTKWVEDVNKNTEGPYLRYYLRPCPVPHTLV